MNIRLDGYQDLLEAARQAASSQGISLNTFVVNALKAAVGMPQDEIPQQTQPLPLEAILEALDSKLDTLLDNRLEQLENRLDTLLDAQLALQSEIEVLKVSLKPPKPDTNPTVIPKATDTPQPSPKSTAKKGKKLFICPNPECKAIGVKGIDFTKDTQALNPELTCKKCGEVNYVSSFKCVS